MLDVLNWAKQRANGNESAILERFRLKRQAYLLATVHRSENTDDPATLSYILSALNSIDEPVIFPVHPRARKMITEMGFPSETRVRVIDPVGYLEMVALASSARMVLTDSGGLQKEAYWLGVPCLTLRNETEWVETVQAGWNALVGHDSGKIVDAVRTFSPPNSRPALYGDGAAADKCVDLLAVGPEPMSLAERTEYANWSA
jgi:UDP-GlcNAc3NAcA epimerase